MSRKSRLPILLVMAGSLVAARFARQQCLDQRLELDPSTNKKTSGNLSQLNSYALGLVLGGLRGPMLMALWTTSENQKNDRELEDFDTKVEMIRLLQAEFDGVHLFQIWNKAFNISVQMANVSTKYVTILDAMQYARNVDSERPNNISIISEIGRLYFDKYGGAAERAYYSPRLMDETLPVQDKIKITFPAEQRDAVLRLARLAGASTYSLNPQEANDQATAYYIYVRPQVEQVIRKNSTGLQLTYATVPAKTQQNASAKATRLTEHPTLLDDNHKLLPGFTGSNMKTESEKVENVDLPYLKQFEPYPIGVSPYALAYNYFKRAQWLQEFRKARHPQVSDRIISVRPAMSLKKWSEESWYAARRAEIEFFMPTAEVPRDDAQLEPITQDIPLTAQVPDSPLLAQIIGRYESSAMVCEAAVKEFRYHLSPEHYPEDNFTYRSHIEGSFAQSKIMRGDALYLQALKSTGEEKIRLAKEAAENYQQGANLYTRHIFQFFMGDEDVEFVLPRDFRKLTRNDIGPDSDKLKDFELPIALLKLKARHAASNYQLSNSVDFVEINSYVERAYARISNINKFLGR